MPDQTAKDLIEQGRWAECWICRDVFRHRRETKRYCAECERGFCEGEHGNFARNRGVCVICGRSQED